MEEDNKLNMQPVDIQGDDLNAEEYYRQKHPGGRPPIEQNIKLQMEYMKMEHMAVVLKMTNQAIATYFNVSVGKVKNGRAWVRKNFERLSPEDCLSEAEFLINARIRDLDKTINTLEEGTPILDVMGNALLDENGKPYLKKQYDLILRHKRERANYDKMFLEARGLSKVNQFIQQQNNIRVEGNINMVTVNQLALIDIMEEDDRATFLNLLEKYAKPPE